MVGCRTIKSLHVHVFFWRGGPFTNALWDLQLCLETDEMRDRFILSFFTITRAHKGKLNQMMHFCAVPVLCACVYSTCTRCNMSGRTR